MCCSTLSRGSGVLGVAITVSTGDDGYGVQFPASSPHVTAVGGTHLVRDGSSRGWNETAWFGARQRLQHGLQPSRPGKPILVAPSARWHDVSAIADPSTGVAVYGPINGTQSGWLVFGGTSVAAPLIGGVYGVNGGSVNYGSNPYGDTDDLFDVTSGQQWQLRRFLSLHGHAGI